MVRISDTVKVALIVGDLTENGAVTRDKSVTVVQYQYSMTRDTDSGGLTFGCASADVFTVIFRVGVRDDFKVFYECLTQSFQQSFSLIFNAKYREDGYLSEYDGAIVIDGYIVGLDEIYNRAGSETEESQATLELHFRVRQMTCVGENNNLVYSF